MKDFLKDFTGNILSKEQMKGVLGANGSCGNCLSGRTICIEVTFSVPNSPIPVSFCTCNPNLGASGRCGYIQN